MFCCLLSALMLFSICLTTANAAVSSCVTVGNVSGQVGETVTVPIEMTGNPGIVAMRIFVSYDTTKLMLLEATDGGLFGQDHDYFGNDITNNPYTLLWEDALSNTNYINNGLLASLSFRILDTAANGKTDITIALDAGSTFNVNVQNVPFSTQNGSVQINEKPTYTATFTFDGAAISTKQYNAGDAIVKPADPTKDGYTFKGWTPAVPSTMPAQDMTFEAVFEKIPDPVIKIHNYTSSRTVDYRTTITFSVDEIQNPVDGASVHWFINGQDKGASDTYTEKEAKQKFTVQAKYMKGNTVLAESETETVNVNAGFFARLKAFFRALFKKLPVVVQEYLGVEIIDRVLP